MKSAKHIRIFNEELSAEGMTPAPSEESITILRNMSLASEVLAAIAMQVEFYVNGKITEEVFLRRYKEIEKKYENKLNKLA